MELIPKRRESLILAKKNTFYHEKCFPFLSGAKSRFQKILRLKFKNLSS
jgi:hypothetical protein